MINPANMKHRFFIILFFLSGSVYAQTPSGSTRPSATARTVPSAYVNPVLNYVRSWEPSMPTTDPAVVTSSSRNVTEVKQATQYLDGLGRPIQTVSKRTGGIATPDVNGGNDMVSMKVYDAFGREQFQYLPYVPQSGNTTDGLFKTDPFTGQASFYQNGTLNPGAAGETIYYGSTDYEASPLNRVLKTYAPGNSWAKEGGNKPVEMQYLVNTAAEDVRIWSIGGFGSYPSSSGTYPTGQLYKNVTIDEMGHQVVEYKNKSGQVVLKKVQIANSAATTHTGWLCTYYVYDDLDNLRFVIPPKAVVAIDGSWSLADATTRSELCFRYEYDGRNRMILKQVPGAKDVYMVYDVRDRLVLSQDGNLRAAGKWMATLYDELNRPIMTGLYTTAQTHAQLISAMSTASSQQTITHTIPAVDVLTASFHDGRAQYKARTEINFIDGFDSGTGETETVLDAGAVESTETIYANNTIPSLSLTPTDLYPLTYTYYDNYDFPGKKNVQPAYFAKTDSTSNPYAETNIVSNQTKGLTTGSKVRILGTNQWITTTSYYDAKGRVQQILADNANNGEDVVTNRYDFNGKLLSTYEYHSNPHSSITPFTKLLTVNKYDHAGRILKVTKQLNDDVNLKRDIAVNTYNAMGQLKEKTMKKAGDVDMESLEYEYNIRGWLRSINKDYVNTTNGGHYFGQELNYDYGFDAQQYNGNIAGIKWKGFNNQTARAYGYSYDNANRLLKADFTQLSGTWAKNPAVNFDVIMGSNGTTAGNPYDANGNILRMQQYGIKGSSSTKIDDITYSYYTGSNKLQATTDASNDASSTLGDFKEATSGATTDYNYDSTGNLKLDGNKQISAIAYNHLNLPEQITITGKGTIQYVYDATGTKLRKIVTDNTVSPARITTTEYIAAGVYQNDTLQFVSHEEGRIRAITTESPVEYVYDYFIKDHLGNVRMVLTEQTSQSLYMASMETESAAKENALFSNVDASRADRPTGYSKEQRIAPSNDYVAKLNGNDPNRRVGPSIVLKVMAGDTIAISTKAFYKSQSPVQKKQALAPVADMATALSLAFGGQGNPGISHGGSGNNTSPLNQQFFNNDYQRLKDKDPGKDPSAQRPKAYLNHALFDDQFKLVDDNSGVRQVQAQPDQVQTLAQGKMVVKKSGFLYVYTSNETPQDVFFDELMVVTNPGAVLEETHYYPYGLTMAGISAKAPGKLENKKEKFQGQPLDDELGLNWYGFKWRNHDPQIGRFIQIDPLSEKYVYNSTYAFSENKVTAHVELEGLESFSIQHFTTQLWNSLGISSSYSAKEFAQDLGTAAKNPDNYVQAGQMLGQAAAFYLAGVMTEGLGSGSLMTAGVRSMRNTAASASLESGEIGLAARARLGTAGAQEAPTTNLFRAVSDAELADVGANGLRMAPGGYETGKLFATSSSDAAQFGKFNFSLDGNPNTIIKVEVPGSVMKTTTTFEADGMQAVSVPSNQLSNIPKVTPLNYSPKPTKPFWMQGW